MLMRTSPWDTCRIVSNASLFRICTQSVTAGAQHQERYLDGQAHRLRVRLLVQGAWHQAHNLHWSREAAEQASCVPRPAWRYQPGLPRGACSCCCGGCALTLFPTEPSGANMSYHWQVLRPHGRGGSHRLLLHCSRAMTSSSAANLGRPWLSRG